MERAGRGEEICLYVGTGGLSKGGAEQGRGRAGAELTRD